MADEKPIKRCAIYTRKSVDEGLEQEYNSLDAQRESAENYIKSQKGSGWVVLPEHYDDGGYSGGNMERPALKRLLADVEAGKIDIILIYKMDRLSRSLLDFMKLAEMLEKHNVSFVSVTQDINTSTSSGRMMLNILMTFAQYEREVIAERIRDKIAGAKRRGKYCGGPPLLGYDVNPETKKLEINRKEAVIVKEAFQLYAKLGSVLDVARILNAKGYRTKSWTSRKGRRHPGQEFVLDTIYRMLNNVIYVGKVQHNGNLYDGEQKAIIDQNLWDKVRFILNENAPVAPGMKKTAIASPFKGLMVCGYCGGAFGISFSTKGDRRYMYYICIKDEDRTERQCRLGRVPAGEVDRLILRQMGRLFKTPALLVQTFNKVIELENQRRDVLQLRHNDLMKKQQLLREQIAEGGDIAELRQQFAQISAEVDEVSDAIKSLGRKFLPRDLAETCGSMETIWEELFPVERYNLAHQLIDRITLYTDRMVMDIRHHGLKSLIKELKAGGENLASLPDEPDRSKEIIRLTIPMVIRHRHGRKIILAPNEVEEDPMKVQEQEHGPSATAKHLARAHTWQEMIESGKVPTVARLADKLGLNLSYVSRTLKLASLSPELQKLIAEGREPASMSLAKLRHEFPDDWQEQEKMFLA